MIRSILLVALGGAMGSVSRYLLSRCFASTFPVGTLLVNLVGCLLIGFLLGLVGKEMLSTDMRLLFITGFCGAFTTFSTFANESLQMMKIGDVLLAALYIALSVVAGIVAVYLGLQISKA